MAKDTRGKNTPQRQVNLAQKAGAAPAKKPGTSRKKKKNSAGRIVVIVLLIILILVSLAFIIVVGKTIYESLASPGENKPEVALSSYVTTPDDAVDKVSYYVVGILGEEDTGEMAALSLVCYDKQAKALQVLQIPVASYLGTGGDWAVTKVGQVYGNPKPLDWCITCRRAIPAAEIQDGRHTICGTNITQNTGSATQNLIQVFNEQYGMAVDNFFLIPQEGFVKLVNLVGGIDVDLEAAMTVDDIEYKKGVQTLDGDAALQYAVSFNYKNTPDSDVERMIRQRKVFTALFQRLTASSMEKLDDEIFSPLMGGSTPIRMNTDTSALSRLLIDPSNRELEDMTPGTALATLFRDLAEVPLSNVSFYVMPGESGKAGSDTVYSIHKADLAALLQESFNPYGEAISADSLQVTELNNSKETDTRKQTMEELQVAQSGTAATTTTAAPTTAAQAS